MSHEMGFNFGNRLERFTLGEAAALAKVDQEVAAARLSASNIADNARLALESAEGAVDRAQRKLDDRLRVSEKWREFRNESPTDFSLGRGFFYFGVGVLLLVGDLTILSGVLAQILGLDFRGEDAAGIFSVTEIVNHPFRSLEVFRNVLVLTSSVLLLGFFPKLFFDMRRSGLEPSYHWALRVVFVAAMAAVVVTAYARWGLETRPPQEAEATVSADTASMASPQSGAGTESRTIFGFASFLLGLALPYASCFFFSVGVDRIGRRLDLWRTTAFAQSAKLSVRQARELVEARQATVATRVAEQEALEHPDYPGGIRSQALADYSRGYADGTVALLDGQGPGATFNALRLIAIRRKLS